MAGPAILLCVGAPKAGTTWLYRYLRSHPDAHMRGVKELHYFDEVAFPTVTHYREAHRARAEGMRQRLRGTPPWRKRDLRAQLRDHDDWLRVRPGAGGDHRDYLAYLSKGVGRRRLVGDVTPCYATLGREIFTQMTALGPDVRFVYLLRDPLDRAWSHARMLGGRRASDTRTPEMIANRNFDLFLKGEAAGFARRSDYASALSALTQVVPRDRLLVTFYENLFDGAELARLTAFLGLRAVPADTERVWNPGVSLKIDPERRKRGLDRLREQYAFCHEFFEGQLPERWQTHMAEA